MEWGDENWKSTESGGDGEIYKKKKNREKSTNCTSAVSIFIIEKLPECFYKAS